MTEEKSGAKPIPLKLETGSEIGWIVGGIAVIIVGSSLGFIIMITGLFSKMMDWEGYNKNEFPLLIVLGGIVILAALVYGVSMITSAIRRRNRKRKAFNEG